MVAVFTKCKMQQLHKLLSLNLPLTTLTINTISFGATSWITKDASEHLMN